MSTTLLTLEEARQVIGNAFVHDMPFNQLLGLELIRFEPDYVEIQFRNQSKLVGNIAQEILHGGVVASVLDVCGGLVCIGNALPRLVPASREELAKRLSTMGTIDLRVDYLRPGRGELFTATSSIIRNGNKVSVARAELHNEQRAHIASVTATYLVG
ncbi:MULTISPECIES: thioesterase family protein [Photorhabdus]|uniref:thioesterase family protein n=1 Tax=Photorhabdus TaxID=29487 RepID=UPI000E59F73A|nr:MULTISPECIES: thioesterase family protein [Photorhabdus]MCA6220685.1 thioesterase family protein [Photorhabdus antumapuensis]